MTVSLLYALTFYRIIGCRDYRTKRYLVRRKTLTRNRAGVLGQLADSMLVLAGLFHVLAKIRVGKSMHDAVFIEPSGEYLAGRKEWIKQELGFDAEHLHWDSRARIHRSVHFIAIATFAFRCFAIALIPGVDGSLSKRGAFKFVACLFQLELSAPGRVVVFNYDGEEVYPLLRWLGLRGNVAVHYCPTNSYLGYQFDRGVYQNLTLVLFSTLQIDEVRHYVQRGWLRFDSVALLLANVPLFAAESDSHGLPGKYDVSFYSSGTWAREGGIWRIEDIQSIRSLSLADNEIYRLEERLIGEFAALSRASGLRSIIYLHPYERYLLSKHGIMPPYLPLVTGVELSTEPGHSDIASAPTSVTMCSSVMYDRYALGLQTLFLDCSAVSKRVRRYFYDPRVIQRVRPLAFRSPTEMRETLMTLLRRASAVAQEPTQLV